MSLLSTRETLVFHIIVMMFISGCTRNNEALHVQTVSMPLLPSELNVSPQPNCYFENAEIEIFGHDAHKVSFRYKLCNGKEKVDFWVSGNRVIRYKDKPLLAFGKTGPHTPRSHMQAMANDASSECFAVKTSENLWLLIDPKPPRRIYGMAIEPSSACGPFAGYKAPKGWVFAISDGVVFGFKQENVRNFIDLSSVTYTETRH